MGQRSWGPWRRVGHSAFQPRARCSVVFVFVGPPEIQPGAKGPLIFVLARVSGDRNMPSPGPRVRRIDLWEHVGRP
eukprot:2240645-Lingulodinium_polyedra.AAC.1